MNIDVNTIEQAINWTAEEWAGQCYAVSCAIVESGIVEGKVRYGHYLGKVHPDSMFSRQSKAGFVQHGWIELEDGSVVDPTRWVFECREPYIYHGPSDDYDVGGSSFREKMREQQGPPIFSPTDQTVDLKGVSDRVLRIIRLLCKDSRQSTVFSTKQLFWLANATPIILGGVAQELYVELDIRGYGSFIPIDYWNLIMED